MTTSSPIRLFLISRGVTALTRITTNTAAFTALVFLPKKNGDYAFLLHILKSLKSTGTGAVIFPHGVLFRGNAEGKLEKILLNADTSKGIIGLPANLFYGTGIPACIIVLDKAGASDRRNFYD